MPGAAAPLPRRLRRPPAPAGPRLGVPVRVGRPAPHHHSAALRRPRPTTHLPLRAGADALAGGSGPPRPLRRERLLRVHPSRRRWRRPDFPAGRLPAALRGVPRRRGSAAPGAGARPVQRAEDADRAAAGSGGTEGDARGTARHDGGLLQSAVAAVVVVVVVVVAGSEDDDDDDDDASAAREGGEGARLLHAQTAGEQMLFTLEWIISRSGKKNYNTRTWVTSVKKN